MKNQYVGDTAQFLTFRLLKALAHFRFELGICLLLTEDVGRELAGDTCHPNDDPDLYNALGAIHAASHRISDLQRSQLLPDTTYFDALMPSAPDLRVSYFQQALASLSGADIVLFEPDKGILVADPANVADSDGWLFSFEVEPFIQEGISILLPTSRRYPRPIAATAEWLGSCKGISMARIIQSANQVLVFGIHNAHAEIISRRWEEILQRSGWKEIKADY